MSSFFMVKTRIAVFFSNTRRQHRRNRPFIDKEHMF